MDDEPESEFYCVYCGRMIAASNVKEILDGEDNGYLFVHDPQIEHNDSDFLDCVIH